MSLFLPPLYLAASAAQVILSVGLLVWWRLHHARGFATMLFWGGSLAIAAWVASRALTWLRMSLGASLPLSSSLFPMLAVAHVVLSVSIEYLIILGGAHRVPIRTFTWEQSVTAGLSYGSAWSVLLVGQSVLSQLGVLTFLPRLPFGSSGLALARAISIRLEQVPIIFFQAFACVLIIYAVQAKSRKWYGLGFVYLLAGPGVAYLLAALPFLAHAFGGLPGFSIGGLPGFSMVELVSSVVASLVLGAVGLWGMRAMRGRWPVVSPDEGRGRP